MCQNVLLGRVVEKQSEMKAYNFVNLFREKTSARAAKGQFLVCSRGTLYMYWLLTVFRAEDDSAVLPVFFLLLGPVTVQTCFNQAVFFFFPLHTYSLFHAQCKIYRKLATSI